MKVNISGKIVIFDNVSHPSHAHHFLSVCVLCPCSGEGPMDLWNVSFFCLIHAG